MERLKNLLTLKSDATPEKIKNDFQFIAVQLFRNYHIRKGEYRYDFLELEFYYHNEKHPEKCVYPRNSYAGDWFFHLSGVDIAFKSDQDKGFYGGILVRALVRTKADGADPVVIAGPLCCMMELMNGVMNVYGAVKSGPVLENNTDDTEVISHLECTKRQGIPGDALYCYYVRSRQNCDPDWKNGKKYYSAKPWNRK